MDIKRENYEIWAIDYLEGRLSTSEAALYMAFLAENPDLAEELDNIRDGSSYLDNEVPETSFNHLKKNYADVAICTKSFEEFCIAYHEDDLDRSEKQILHKYLRNDSKKQIFNTYKQLKVQADERILFQNKDILKKTALVQNQWAGKRLLQITSSIAAAILILFVLFIDKPFGSHSTNSLVDISYQPKETVQTKINVSKTILQESISSHITSVPSENTIQPRKKEHDVAISAVDSSKEDIFIPIKRIEITQIPGLGNESTIILNPSQEVLSNFKISRSKMAINNIRHNSQKLISRTKNLSFDHLLRNSINGLNQLAEADLKYNSETNDEGKIIAFGVTSERFNLKRKLRNN